MITLRAIISGIIVWALIFAEWSIIIFTPGLKDLGNWQYLIHYIILIPLVIIGLSFYYKEKDKTNRLILGATMLITGLILDAIITIPFFTIPQGTGYTEFFFNPLMIIGYIEFLLISWIYGKKK